MSDVDLAILFDDEVDASRRFELAAALVEEAERATEQQVDLAILNEAPPLLRHRVVRDGLLVYTRDERRRVAFEARALTEYLDFDMGTHCIAALRLPRPSTYADIIPALAKAQLVRPQRQPLQTLAGDKLEVSFKTKAAVKAREHRHQQ